jgi:hypothetical protein
MHVRLDTNSVFYIGKGEINYKGISHRAKSKQRRNNHWINITNKTDWRFDILRIFDSEIEALVYETRCIDMFGIHIEGGQLCNIIKNTCDGGVSLAKLNSIQVHKYSLDGDYIESYDSITNAANINNVNDTHIGGVCNGIRVTCKGFQYRYYKVDKIDSVKAHKKREKYLRPVYQYTKDGILLEKFNSIQTASDKTNISYFNINHVLNGIRKTANGYKWSYELIEN